MSPQLINAGNILGIFPPNTTSGLVYFLTYALCSHGQKVGYASSNHNKCLSNHLFVKGNYGVWECSVFCLRDSLVFNADWSSKEGTSNYSGCSTTSLFSGYRRHTLQLRIIPSGNLSVCQFKGCNRVMKVLLFSVFRWLNESVRSSCACVP